MAAPHPSEPNFLVTFLPDGWLRLLGVAGFAGLRTCFLRLRANGPGAVAMAPLGGSVAVFSYCKLLLSHKQKEMRREFVE